MSANVLCPNRPQNVLECPFSQCIVIQVMTNQFFGTGLEESLPCTLVTLLQMPSPGDPAFLIVSGVSDKIQDKQYSHLLTLATPVASSKMGYVLDTGQEIVNFFY